MVGLWRRKALASPKCGWSPDLLSTQTRLAGCRPSSPHPAYLGLRSLA